MTPTELVEAFKAQVAQNADLTTFIDNIEPRDHGLNYRFDGYLSCHIVIEGARLVDVQDVMEDWTPEDDLEGWLRFDSLDAFCQSITSMLAN